MSNRAPRLMLLCAGLCALLAVAAANASAATLYVSHSGSPAPGGKSCSQPNYSKIQEALDAGATTVDICAGTYAEQLIITKAANLTVVGTAGSATVVLPPAPVDATTACDTAPGTEAHQQDGVSICTVGTVNVTGLNFEPKWPAGTCNNNLYGILVAGGATLRANNVTVNGGGAFPINGCQGGIGIEIGMAWTTPVEVGHAYLKGVTVANYQKNGIEVDGQGSTGVIGTTTVTGAGATPETAQNGIQVSNGGLAKISASKISGNECDLTAKPPTTPCGSNAFADYQATGVLFYGAAPKSSLVTSELRENDIGAYYYSTSSAQPATPEVTLSKDVIAGNRYEGVVLDQGKASLVSDTISGPGNIGIDLFQYEQQTLASQSKATGSKIEGQSEASIKVESDKGAGDKPGKFIFTKGTAAAPVLINESNTFVVEF